MTVTVPVLYSMDTSGFLDGWVRYYPPEHFPKLWVNVEQLIADGRLVASEEVAADLKVHADDVYRWVRRQGSNLLVPTPGAVWNAATAIGNAHVGLVHQTTSQSRSDPFVIAVAQLRGATVVTGERGGSAAHPKIPFVCAQMKIPVCSFSQLIRDEGWVF